MGCSVAVLWSSGCLAAVVTGVGWVWIELGLACAGVVAASASALESESASGLAAALAVGLLCTCIWLLHCCFQRKSSWVLFRLLNGKVGYMALHPHVLPGD